jgi:hypothetical protein
VVGEQLPSTGGLRQALALRVFGGVGVVDHVVMGEGAIQISCSLPPGVGHLWSMSVDFLSHHAKTN